MKNNASFLYSLFLVLSDAVVLVAAFIGAYVLRAADDTPVAQPIPSSTYIMILLTLIPFWIIIFSLIGLYNRSVYDKRFQEMGRLFVGTIIGTLFIIGYAYFSNEPIFPAKLVPIYGLGLTFMLLVLSRNLMRLLRQFLFARNIGISNVLLVGNTDATHELVAWLANPKASGYRVVGIVGGHKQNGVRHFATFEDAVKALRSKGIHSIMQTELFADTHKNDEIVSYAQNNHIAYRFIPGNSELFVGNIDVELFQSSIPMIAVHQTALFGWGRIIKRIFDLLISIPLIIILSPLMLIIAIINKFVSGSVFFRQTRLTRFNKKFRVYKFRSQYKKYDGTTPEEAFAMMGKPELARKYRENGDFLHDDPRVTKFGRFLRTTSLDELPQLFNVIKGDLSLVGPRALIPQELAVYSKRHAILSVKSGLTGLAQVSGRKQISFDERRKLDLYYVQNWNFWLDITILLKTIRVVFSRQGAE